IILRKINSDQIMIKDVLWVPNVHENLLSVGQLIERGMNLQFSDTGTVTIKKENRVISTGQTEGRMFLLDIVSSTNSKADSTMIAKTQNSSTTDLWHRRLGHINHSSLKKVQKMVDGLEDQKLDEENSICEACI